MYLMNFNVLVTVHKVALGQVFFSNYLSVPLSVSFHQCCIITCILELFLLERRAGEVW
jgi:hypothetical protein